MVPPRQVQIASGQEFKLKLIVFLNVPAYRSILCSPNPSAFLRKKKPAI